MSTDYMIQSQAPNTSTRFLFSSRRFVQQLIQYTGAVPKAEPLPVVTKPEDTYCVPLDLILKGLTIDLEKFDVLKNRTYDSEVIKAFSLRLARDLSTYDNMLAAGRLLLFDINRACGSISDYVALMSHRLNRKTQEFMLAHAAEIDADIEANMFDDYACHDAFSASTVIKSYMLRPAVFEEPWETPQQMYFRVAIQTYGHLGWDRVLKCKHTMARGYYTGASPVLFNSGTTRSQLASCFLIQIGDDIESILKVGVYVTSVISAANGGIGMDVSNLRHSQIGHEGMASGPVTACRIYDKSIKWADQIGSRNGACTVFNRLHNFDIGPFVRATDNYGDHKERFATINTCIWTTLYFFEKVKRGEPWYVFCPAKAPILNQVYGYEYEVAYEATVVEALKRKAVYERVRQERDELKNRLLTAPTPELRAVYKAKIQELVMARKHQIEFDVFEKAGDLLALIVKNQVGASTPYVMHGDACNWKNNQKHLGPISSSNLCVAGETPILTREGYIPIVELVGKEVEIWNGDAWSTVIPRQTSERAKLVYVVLDNGLWVTCTPQHKFLTGYAEPKGATRVEAQNLKPGTVLVECDFPVIPGVQRLSPETARALGLELGTHHIPHGDSVEVRLSWFGGLIDSDCTVIGVDIETYVQIRSSSQEFIHSLQLMLQTLGVRSKSKKTVESQVMTLPGNYTYTIDPVWTLYLGTRQVSKLVELGLKSPKLEGLELKVCSQIIFERVVGVYDSGREEPTYCFTEPLNHAGVFNGVLTGNCLEIIEYTHPGQPEKPAKPAIFDQPAVEFQPAIDPVIASCNLGSHNVGRHVKGRVDTSSGYFHGEDLKFEPSKTKEDLEALEALKRIVIPYTPEAFKTKMREIIVAYDWETFAQKAREMVDDIDERISSGSYPLDRLADEETLLEAGPIRRTNLEMRPLAIGVSGFADALMMMDIAYVSLEADFFNRVFFACKYFNELCQTIARAAQFGPYPGITKGSFKRYVGLKDGVPQYETLEGAPFKHGILQFDLWAEEAQMRADRKRLQEGTLYSGYDRADDTPIEPEVWGQKPFTFTDASGEEHTIAPTWGAIREALKRFGARNSMLGAIMPTATVASIFRNAESTEPYQANVFARDTITGSHLLCNRHLEKDLAAIGCWSPKLPKFVIIDQGSIRNIAHYISDHPDEFPAAFELVNPASPQLQLKPEVERRLRFLVEKYRTTYEIRQKWIILQARVRGIYLDQSQSLNIHLEDPKEVQLSAIHAMTANYGLKTGMYYLRQSPATFIEKFSADIRTLMYYQQLIERIGMTCTSGMKAILKKLEDVKSEVQSIDVTPPLKVATPVVEAPEPPKPELPVPSEVEEIEYDGATCPLYKGKSGCMACQ